MMIRRHSDGSRCIFDIGNILYRVGSNDLEITIKGEHP